VNQVLRVIFTSNPGIHSKGNTITRITSQYKKYRDLSGFITRNHSISTTRKTAQGPIQRYKASYSQNGVIQLHSGRIRLVARRYGWIQNIANPLLAPTLLPDMFCNKNNAISPEAIGEGGRQPLFPPEKASDTASTSSPQKQPGWLRCEEQGRRPERK
jgi:hypothetical protein